jgi:hypothetical protein
VDADEFEPIAVQVQAKPVHIRHVATADNGNTHRGQIVSHENSTDRQDFYQLQSKWRIASASI